MKLACTALATLAATVALSGAAMAQDQLIEHSTVGVWSILIDPTIGNGCLINAEFQDGSDVRIGFDREAGTGYVLAANSAWEGIEEGTVYPIKMDVDGSVYDGEGKGIIIDDVPGVDIEFDNVDLLLDIAAKQTLTLLNDNGPVMAIDLTDSLAALEAAIACQDEQG